ncbi:DUF1857-domain-containing protein [Mycena maculata]|uniref:DUF1857-domain-containing protein n=1 Tax=Mycena maculata TaxID=230809 RepID=A0AAD7MM33_9AGAR|nr:DUF1857-domain-containing protein [Mycena maculata]
MTSAIAATRPVNPPDAQPVLTEKHLWRGLEYRARNPALFLPNVPASKMITDGGNKIVQELTVKNEDQTETEVLTETIQAYPSTIMYHEVSNGLRIVTVVSRGAAGELLLTFSFANRELPAGKPKPTPEEENARIGKILEKTIAMFREMVSEGKL